MPNLIGTTLGGARRRLQQVGCSVGTVTRPQRGRRVRVFRQSVGAGTNLTAGSPVDVSLRATRQRR